MPKTIKKLIDLPTDVVSVLKKDAEKNQYYLKNYMQKILIDHAKNIKKLKN